MKLSGRVDGISDLIKMERVGKKTLYKKILDISLKDNQRLFIDVIGPRLKDLNTDNIIIGSYISFEIKFKASEKNGNTFNNIFCSSIEKT